MLSFVSNVIFVLLLNIVKILFVPSNLFIAVLKDVCNFASVTRTHLGLYRLAGTMMKVSVGQRGGFTIFSFHVLEAIFLGFSGAQFLKVIESSDAIIHVSSWVIFLVNLKLKLLHLFDGDLVRGLGVPHCHYMKIIILIGYNSII